MCLEGMLLPCPVNIGDSGIQKGKVPVRGEFRNPGCNSNQESMVEA